MDIDFSGRVYLITGGASGIGEAIVHFLAQHGGKAIIADINDDWINRIPLSRAGTADEIASLVVFLLSPASSYITGTEIVIDGGMGSTNNQPNIPVIFAAM